MRGQQPRHSRYVAVGKVWFLDGSRARLPRAILAVKAYFFCSIQTSKGNDRPQPPGRTPATQPCLGKLLGITLLIFFSFYFLVSRLRYPTCQLCSGHSFPASVLYLFRMDPNNCDDQTTVRQAGHLCECYHIFFP